MVPQGGGSDQKIEIEIIVSSLLDTSCELGKDILSPNSGLKANFLYRQNGHFLIYNSKLTILAQFLCLFLSFDMDIQNAYSHLDLVKLDQNRMGNFRRCLETSV